MAETGVRIASCNVCTILVGIYARAKVVMYPIEAEVSYGTKLCMVMELLAMARPLERPSGKYMKICAEESELSTTNS